MSVTISNITEIVRRLVDDTADTQKDVFIYDTSNIFTLSEPNIVEFTRIYVNDISSGVTYTYNSTTQKVTVTSSLTVGDVVTLEYTCYYNYSTNEIHNNIRNALVHISLNKYKDFKEVDTAIYPEPTDAEKNLIAIVASILIDPDNISYKLPDLAIKKPDNLPTRKIISEVIRGFKASPVGIFSIIEGLV